MPVQRTPEQEAVVKNRGGGLLVSAAAGSGKTRVLVERLLDRILTEGKNVDEFLIITFTRAAAEELRGRIGQELSQALAAQPDNGHLRRQSGKLYQTQISTIHAFCTVLLRQWGHLLDVPADFALCEEEEAQVLMDRTLNQVLEARYEEVDPEGNFARLLDILSAGRDDSRLMDITLDVYGKIQSAQDPLAWLEVQRKALDLSGITDVGQTPWGALLLEEARDTAAYWAGQMAKACALSQEDAALEKAYGESLQTTQQGLEAFCQAASQGWDQAAQAHIPFPRLKAARGVEAIGAQEQIKAIREGCKKAVEGMLDRMVQVLGEGRARVFHSHFSKIEYTPRGGEARHLTFDQPYFGPDYHPLCQALARRGWAPRVICESAGTQDVDALAMQRAYRQALGEGP